MAVWLAVFAAAGIWAYSSYQEQEPAALCAFLAAAGIAFLLGSGRIVETRRLWRLWRAEEAWEIRLATRPRDWKSSY